MPRPDKLSLETKELLFSMLEKGRSVASLAKEFSVSPVYIYKNRNKPIKTPLKEETLDLSPIRAPSFLTLESPQAFPSGFYHGNGSPIRALTGKERASLAVIPNPVRVVVRREKGIPVIGFIHGGDALKCAREGRFVVIGQDESGKDIFALEANSDNSDLIEE